MESFGSIECFVRSAEGGSFAEAARHLSLTPAAVGKSVAKLEARLGVRLFQRSTRRLTLTEAGKLFLEEVSGSLTHHPERRGQPGQRRRPAGGHAQGQHGPGVR